MKTRYIALGISVAALSGMVLIKHWIFLVMASFSLILIIIEKR